ncbi:hypothetical protein J6590_000969 [Homalodisca vitripennis]|nr:hypothetical protein J6590_000969 [Homalodisca vitripennis]
MEVVVSSGRWSVTSRSMPPVTTVIVQSELSRFSNAFWPTINHQPLSHHQPETIWENFTLKKISFRFETNQTVSLGRPIYRYSGGKTVIAFHRNFETRIPRNVQPDRQMDQMYAVSKLKDKKQPQRYEIRTIITFDTNACTTSGGRGYIGQTTESASNDRVVRDNVCSVSLSTAAS